MDNETIKGYPTTLRIFQIEDSPFWYVRFYHNGKMVKRSTKTTKKSDAISFAKQFYITQLQNPDSGQKSNKQHSLITLAEQIIEEDEQKVKRGERSKSIIRDQLFILTKDLQPFFGATEAKDVNYQLLLKYVGRLSDRELASGSIKRNLAFIKKVMRHAVRVGAINNIPEFPVIAHKDSPRAWLSQNEYKTLLRHTKKLAEQGLEVRGKAITHEMELFIKFMVNTFLRPSDVKLLCHKHIDVVVNQQTRYLRITTDFSKTALYPVISMPFATNVYEEIRLRQKALGYNKANDFVFMPQYQNRDFALETLRRQFDEVLKSANLKSAMTGASRTIYSLRHTAIMFRLIMGDNVDLLTLARNARTSVEMIDRFYAKHLTAEMNVDKLQSLKGGRYKDRQTKASV